MRKSYRAEVFFGIDIRDIGLSFRVFLSQRYWEASIQIGPFYARIERA
jgi:hypothetical protein